MTTKTLNSLIIAAILAASATVGVQVAASPTSAPVASSDDSIVLIVPISTGLNRTTSPVIRITR